MQRVNKTLKCHCRVTKSCAFYIHVSCQPDNGHSQSVNLEKATVSIVYIRCQMINLTMLFLKKIYTCISLFNNCPTSCVDLHIILDI